MRPAFLTAALLVPLSLGVLSYVLPPPPQALATKDYARQEDKQCAHCHISDKGAGARNAKGQEYEANGYKFGVQSWSSDANRTKFLRANSARMATWYGESFRLLDELEAGEKLPGGQALVSGTKDRMKMFPRSWLRSAQKLLAKGDRGLPNALVLLCKLESQFPSTDEGKDALKQLETLAGEAKTADAVSAARRSEAYRVTLLTGRTELGLAQWDEARRLLESVLTAEAAADYHQDARELLEQIP